MLLQACGDTEDGAQDETGVAFSSWSNSDIQWWEGIVPFRLRAGIAAPHGCLGSGVGICAVTYQYHEERGVSLTRIRVRCDLFFTCSKDSTASGTLFSPSLISMAAHRPSGNSRMMSASDLFRLDRTIAMACPGRSMPKRRCADLGLPDSRTGRRESGPSVSKRVGVRPSAAAASEGSKYRFGLTRIRFFALMGASQQGSSSIRYSRCSIWM